MGQTLKDSAISGAKWNGALNISKYAITFFLSIILARLLEPSEFGLMGMLTIFISVATVFVDSGLGVAIIRGKDTTEKDLTTVFYFNIVVSASLYLLLFFAAPLIADFYNQPKLIPLTRLVSLVFLINSLGLIQNAILIKNLNFRKQSICYFIGILASTVISIIMAFKGMGVYSIVGQAVSQAFFINLSLWLSSKWRPKTGFNKASFLKLWKFGSNVLGTNIVTKIIDNIDNILIGKIFSASALGFYVRAKSSKQLPLEIFMGVVNATSFPVLSKISDKHDEFTRLHYQFYKISCYVFLPVIFGFIAVAKAFTVVLYSAKWLPAVPLLRIVLLTALPVMLGALFNQTFMAKGQGKLYFRLNSFKKVITLLCLPFGLFWGMIPFLWSLVGISIVGMFLSFYYGGKSVNLTMKDYLIPLIKYAAIGLLMCALTYGIQFIPLHSYFLTLLIQLFTGFVTYTLLSIIFKIPEFFYVKQIAREQLIGLRKRLIRKKR